ncbi:HAMP domain-containing protein, partial [bacterium]|nr:HAMP domain-containing protein [bacterium]
MVEIIRKQGRKALFAEAEKVGAEEKAGKSERIDEYADRQLKGLLQALEALRKGDMTVRLEKEKTDIYGELADSYNTMIDQLSTFASEVTRVAKVVGIEGKLGAQAEVPGVAGTWKDLTDNVNMLAANLTNQVRNIAEVNTAVANGDLTKKITVDATGEILELKDTLN